MSLFNQWIFLQKRNKNFRLMFILELSTPSLDWLCEFSRTRSQSSQKLINLAVSSILLRRTHQFGGKISQITRDFHFAIINDVSITFAIRGLALKLGADKISAVDYLGYQFAVHQFWKRQKHDTRLHVTWWRDRPNKVRGVNTKFSSSRQEMRGKNETISIMKRQVDEYKRLHSRWEQIEDKKNRTSLEADLWFYVRCTLPVPQASTASSELCAHPSRPDTTLSTTRI